MMTQQTFYLLYTRKESLLGNFISHMFTIIEMACTLFHVSILHFIVVFYFILLLISGKMKKSM